MDKEKTYRFLSWGCGVQSTTLGEMAAQGLLDPLDAVVHCDTGWERRATYETRDWYADRWRKMGLPVYITSNGNIRIQGAQEHIHMPFWTSDGGPLRRQCTREFKLVPAKRQMREIANYHATKPPHPKPGQFEVWLGISLDEWRRSIDRKTGIPMRPKEQFMINRWPLLEKKMARSDCIAFLETQGLPVPIKSACIGCVFRQASEWVEMRDTSPEEFSEAIAFDEENRDNLLASRGAGSTADKLYIYKHDNQPLATADLEEDAKRERQKFGVQIPMLCESGWCHV